MMKLVIAIIQPTKLSAVREAMEKIEVTRMTVCDAQGFGRQRGRSEMFRGHEYTTTLLRKVALEIIVNDDFLDRTVETIINTARTGPEGHWRRQNILLPAEQAFRSTTAPDRERTNDRRITTTNRVTTVFVWLGSFALFSAFVVSSVVRCRQARLEFNVTASPKVSRLNRRRKHRPSRWRPVRPGGSRYRGAAK